MKMSMPRKELPDIRIHSNMHTEHYVPHNKSAYPIHHIYSIYAFNVIFKCNAKLCEHCSRTSLMLMITVPLSLSSLSLLHECPIAIVHTPLSHPLVGLPFPRPHLDTHTHQVNAHTFRTRHMQWCITVVFRQTHSQTPTGRVSIQQTVSNAGIFSLLFFVSISATRNLHSSHIYHVCLCLCVCVIGYWRRWQATEGTSSNQPTIHSWRPPPLFVHSRPTTPVRDCHTSNSIWFWYERMPKGDRGRIWWQCSNSVIRNECNILKHCT